MELYLGPRPLVRVYIMCASYLEYTKQKDIQDLIFFCVKIFVFFLVVEFPETTCKAYLDL